MSSPVFADLRASVAEPVHLNPVSATDRRYPSGRPRRAASRQRALAHRRGAAKAAGERTKPVVALNAPPPVRKTAPVGNPATLRALKPKPVLASAAAAADTPATSAMHAIDATAIVPRTVLRGSARLARQRGSGVCVRRHEGLLYGCGEIGLPAGTCGPEQPGRRAHFESCCIVTP